jgi:hypothetical protein
MTALQGWIVMAYLQSITMVSCPPAAFPHLGLSRNKTPVLLSAITAASSSPMFISRMSPAGDRPPSCSAKTRRGGSRPISPSYRTYSRSVKLLEDGAGSAGAVRTDGSAA